MVQLGGDFWGRWHLWVLRVWGHPSVWHEDTVATCTRGLDLWERHQEPRNAPKTVCPPHPARPLGVSGSGVTQDQPRPR